MWITPDISNLSLYLTKAEYAAVTQDIKAGATSDDVVQAIADGIIKKIQSACGTLGRARGPVGTMPDEATDAFKDILAYKLCKRLPGTAGKELAENRKEDMLQAFEWLKWAGSTLGSIAPPDSPAPAAEQASPGNIVNLGGKRNVASSRQTGGLL